MRCHEAHWDSMRRKSANGFFVVAILNSATGSKLDDSRPLAVTDLLTVIAHLTDDELKALQAIFQSTGPQIGYAKEPSKDYFSVDSPSA